MAERGPMRVAVIGGGANDEHDVSLASADAAARAIGSLGLEAVPLTIERDGRWRAAAGPVSAAEAVSILTGCDVAFPVLHGVHGEDGAVAGLLELTGVPYAGSPVRAGALGMDKWVTKLVAGALGLPTARAALVRDRDAPVSLAPPLVVKPTAGGSSNGVSIVRDAGDLPAAIDHALEEGGTALVEEFVVGREVDIAVFRDRTGALRPSAALEIGVAPGAVFDRDQKYDGTASFTVPARLAPEERAALEAAALALYERLGCAGVARFDFFLTDSGPVLNEVNTAPGFTERSQVPRMYGALGLDYAGLVRELLAAVVEVGGRTPAPR